MEKNKKKKELLIFKNFQLEQISFEIRFDCEHYYFNVFRPFWSKIQNQIEVDSFRNEDGVTSVKYEDKFEIQVSSSSFAITQFFPDSSLKELLKVSEIFFDTAKEILNIETITRVGLRPIYVRDCNDAVSVAEMLYQTPYINYPDNLYLTKNATPLIPTLAIGWQDEEKGITYRLKGRAENLGITLPLKLVASGKFQKTIETVYNQIILDIDVYVHKPITPGQFILNEWVKSAYETVKTEGLKFFGEK